MSKKPTLGLMMIVRNEAHNLPRLLPLAVGFFDQVVVVDTGSEDATIHYVRNTHPSVELHSFKWTENFSEARNFALSKLNTDYFMWLDADDLIHPANAKGWRRVVGKLEKENLDYAFLPYWYSVDDAGFPLLIQYRERIMRDPSKWEWREAVHEVCCFKDESSEPKGVYITEHPVSHKPDRGGFGDGNRNWRILQKNMLNNVKDMRTLFYIQREAFYRGQEEYSILTGKELVRTFASGWMHDESLLLLAQSYAMLYKRDNVEEYAVTAEAFFQAAIGYAPDRNDFRYDYINFLLHSNRILEALEQAQSLRETMPFTAACVASNLYGGFSHAVLARIYSQYLNRPQDAVEHHLKSLEFPNPHEIIMDNHEAIRKFVQNNDYGIVYADEDLVESGGRIVRALKSRNLCRDWILTTNSLAVGLANSHYVHVTNDPNSVYREDFTPGVKRWLVSNSVEKPYGWQDSAMIPSNEDTIEAMLDTFFDSLFVWFPHGNEQTIEDGLRRVRGEDKQFSLLLFTSPTSVKSLITKPLPRDTVRLVLTPGLELLAIYGWTETIQQLSADGQNILVDNCDKLEFEALPFANKWTGVQFKVVVQPAKKPSAVFVASGLEPWDGRTPYTQGIGASETGVIYVAEELYKKGWNVTVYNTVDSPRVICGVQYAPLAHFNMNGPQVDLFVSSRMPGYLNKRHGSTQVLWTHDAIQQYGEELQTCMADFIVCVSPWQADEAVKAGVPEWKTKAIVNGINQFGVEESERVPGRLVWISQPERGLTNLLEMVESNLIPNDLWVLYGFYNVYESLKSYKTFRAIHNLKYRLRVSKAKIVGRIPIQDVKAMLRTVDKWAYPSGFPETFCVSALECADAGVSCLVQNNGATSQTLDYCMGSTAKLVTTANHYHVRHISRWVKAINEFQGVHTPLPGKYLYKNIADEWIGLTRRES
jgi:glycosyltransferase involved in cell wall biosynthesis